VLRHPHGRPDRRSRQARHITILLTNTTWTSPRPPDVALDFLSATYAAIDD
jgi:hypothetical protein